MYEPFDPLLDMTNGLLLGCNSFLQILPAVSRINESIKQALKMSYLYFDLQQVN